jgi:23S rRNA pseudouridine1911/1915/1917 synthase
MRADVALAAWLEESRARTQQRLAAGQVRAAGHVIAKSYRLQAGDRVEVAPPEAEPPPGPPPEVAVRYADEHLLVVSKPPGLVVHRGAGTRGPTLVDALTAAGVRLAPVGDAVRPGIVHRLDRGTSGLLVVASTTEALEGLQALLRRHEVERRYWALAEGVPEQPHATIDAPIARHPTRRTSFAVVEGGRRAVTHYDVVEQHGPAAELDVRLETGRTHQVRVHLAAIGHPIVGDRLYGASKLGERLGLDRPALHSRRLAFVHPVTGERVDVTEPLPPDLRRALEALSAADS